MRSIVSVFLLAAGALAQTPEAQRAFQNGVEAYRNGQYASAAEYFKLATQKGPAWIDAHLCLGATYVMNYVPGAENPGNLGWAEAAESTFKKALELSPTNEIALSALGYLAFMRASSLTDSSGRPKLLDQSSGWYEKVIAADPKNRDGYYMLGVLDWFRVYSQLMATRSSVGMKPEDPGPIRILKARRDLRSRAGSIVEDGINRLTRAFEIDPNFADALAYLNLCVREKADLAETAAEYARLIRQADDYLDKAQRLMKAHAASTWEPKGQLPIGMSWMIMASPPPPPPPPPPPRRRGSRAELPDPTHTPAMSSITYD